MNRRAYRKRWLLYHSRYEKKGLSLFRKAIKEAINIPYNNLTLNSYEAVISLNVREEPITQAFFDLYYQIGLRHGKKIGKAINKELKQEKNFNPDNFENTYRNVISQWLINNGGQKIISVREELIEYLIKFISQKVEEGNDIRTIAKLIEQHIKSQKFYKWQLLRIVRTETTAAANYGATQAGNSSGIVWQKEWISSHDARTRRKPDDLFDHYDIDGVKIDKEDRFDVNGDFLSYPGDPKGHPANVINCRCTVAIVPKRDANGRIIRTTNNAFELV